MFWQQNKPQSNPIKLLRAVESDRFVLGFFRLYSWNTWLDPTQYWEESVGKYVNLGLRSLLILTKI